MEYSEMLPSDICCRKPDKQRLAYLTTDWSTLLPSEIWHEILGYLVTSDLMNVVRVSHTFHELGSNILRTSHKLTIKRENVFRDGLVSLLSQTKFNKIGIDLSEKNSGNHRAIFSKYWLTRFLNDRQEIVKFSSNCQVEEVLFNMSSLRLKAKLGSKIYDLFNSLFEFVARPSSQICVVDFEGSDLSCVDLNLFSDAMSRVLIANLSNSWLPSSHLTQLFKSTGLLQFLSLAQEDLSGVHPDFLSTGVTKLRCVDLTKTFLTCHQMEVLLRNISRCPHLILEDLSIRDNQSLSQVNSKLLGEAVERLVSVDISHSSLSTCQVTDMFHHLTSSTSLTSLYISNVRMTDVDPHLLANVMANMTSLDISGTELTSDQANILCSLMKNINKSRYLCIDSQILVNLSDHLRTTLLTCQVTRLLISGLGSLDPITRQVCKDLLQSKSLEDVNGPCMGFHDENDLIGQLNERYPSIHSLLDSYQIRKIFLSP